MIKTLILSLVILLTVCETSKATAVGSTPTPIEFQYSAPGPYNERPPVFVEVDGKRRYYSTTDHTHSCDGDHSLLADHIFCDNVKFVSGASHMLYQPKDIPTAEHKRNYYGVYGVAKVGNDIITAMHGENKNVYRSDTKQYFQNTVYQGPDALAPPEGNCFSGYTGDSGEYQDCYEAYSGFVGTMRNGIDLGPAVWPKYGYASHDRSKRLGHGVRHPSIINGQDGYLYMYYYDTGNTKPEHTIVYAKDAGIRVARSKVNDRGRNWSTWVAKRGQWVPSLPKGVSAVSSRRALAIPSPAQSQVLFSATTMTLDVAKVANQHKWIGVHQGPDFNGPLCTNPHGQQEHVWRTYLRTTRDMVHWSHPVHVTGLDFCGYSGEPIAYPEFLKADGSSTKLVDLNEFYLIGAGLGSVHRTLVKTTGL